MTWKEIASGITNENGIFSTTYTGQGIGNIRFKAICEIDGQEIESDPITISDLAEELTLTANKNILSYADGDSCTLTATLTGDNVSNRPVVFKNGNTVLDTVNTDSNGIATYNYESQGVGDVTITVECMNLQETYSIEDCNYANSLTSADSTHWTIPSSANASYSNEGMKLQGSSWSDCFLEIPLNKPININFDVSNNGSSNNAPPLQVYFYDASNKDRKYHVWYEANTRKLINDYYNSQSNSSGSFTLPSAFNMEIKVKSDSIEVYLDGGLYVTKSNYNLVSPFIFGVTTSSNRYATYKNLKIKPL